MTMPGLICSYILDGKGGANPVGWETIEKWTPADGLLWIHMDRRNPSVQQWVEEKAGVDEIISEALLTEETRPRCSVFNEGVLVILRGINHNQSEDPDEMISVRCWFDHKRIITLRYFHMKSIQDIRDWLEKGEGPATQGEFTVWLLERLSNYMAPVLQKMDEEMDDIEEEALNNYTKQLRHSLADLRRQAIILRRYIAPQVEAARQLHKLPLSWVSSDDKIELLEIVNITTRFVEDLDSVRERAQVVQDEIDNQSALRLNRILYYLSLVTAIFLPLTFITGLLGINVGGIPGTESPFAFWWVSGLMVVLIGFQVWMFHRLRLF